MNLFICLRQIITWQRPLNLNSSSDPSATETAITRRRAYTVLGVLMLIYISSFVDRQIVAVLAVQIRDELGLSNLQSGLLYGTAFSFIYAFAGLPMGRIADLHNRKWLIISGLLCWSAATVASGYAQSFTVLIIARLAVGVSQAMLSPAVYSLLADYFAPQRRGTVYSLYASSIFVGVALSFLIGGAISQAYDWRAAMIAVGLPGFAIALAALFLIKEVTGSRSKNQEASTGRTALGVLKYMLNKPTVRYHLLGFSFLAFLGYTILAFMSTVLADMFGRSDLIPHFGWFMLGTGVSVTLSGRIADYLARYSPKYRFVMGFVAALGGIPLYLIGLLWVDHGLAALLLIGTAVIFSSSYNGVAAALLQYLVKSDMRALAGGLYLFVISVVGFGIGPPLTGWLMDAVFNGPGGPGKALVVVIIGCAIGAVLSFIKAIQHYPADAEVE